MNFYRHLSRIFMSIIVKFNNILKYFQIFTQHIKNICECIKVELIQEIVFMPQMRIKNYLRSTQTDDKLSNLSSFSIDNEMLSELNYEDLIDTFTRTKCRRKSIV